MEEDLIREIEKEIENLEIEADKKYILSIKIDGLMRSNVIRAVDKLNEKLESKGIDRNNIVFFTDNGLSRINLIEIPNEVSVSVKMSKDKLEFNVYDMLVIEDENGSIYQDCVTRISKWKDNIYIVEGDRFVINSDSLEVTDGYMQDRYIIKRDTTIERTYTLKEIWTKFTDNTYKKIWEK